MENLGLVKPEQDVQSADTDAKNSHTSGDYNISDNRLVGNLTSILLLNFWSCFQNPIFQNRKANFDF